MAKKIKVNPNSDMIFTDSSQYGELSLKIKVFDPRLEKCETSCDLEALENLFGEWIDSTPDDFEAVKAFHKWVDQTWQWLTDMDDEVIVGEEEE